MTLEETIQYEWAQTLNDFIFQLHLDCTCVTDGLTDLDNQRHHFPLDITGDLDHCSADDSAGASFSYGMMMALRAVAQSLTPPLRLDLVTNCAECDAEYDEDLTPIRVVARTHR